MTSPIAIQLTFLFKGPLVLSAISMVVQDLKTGGIWDNFNAVPVWLICVFSPYLPDSS